MPASGHRLSRRPRSPAVAPHRVTLPPPAVARPAPLSRLDSQELEAAGMWSAHDCGLLSAGAASTRPFLRARSGTELESQETTSGLERHRAEAARAAPSVWTKDPRVTGGGPGYFPACLSGRPNLGCWHSRRGPGPRSFVWQGHCCAGSAPTVSMLLREDHSRPAAWTTSPQRGQV